MKLVYENKDRGITLYQGSCIELFASLMPHSVDHVISDPPYEAEAHTLQRRVKRGGGVEEEPLSFVAIDENMRDLCGMQFGRLARRWVLVFCQVEAAMLWRTSLEVRRVPMGVPPESLPRWRDLGDDEGLSYLRTCIWVKTDPQPQLTGDRPGMGYESIVTAHSRSQRSKWNGGGTVGVFTHSKVDSENRRLGNQHPTQKPQSLMRELVSKFTDEGDLVLDPFAGSASTLVACRVLGRRAIGIELDEGFAEIAAERLRALDKQGSMFDEVRKEEAKSSVVSTIVEKKIESLEVRTGDGVFPIALEKPIEPGDSISVELKNNVSPIVLAIPAPENEVRRIAVESETLTLADTGALHRCDALEGRPWLYVPALDFAAVDVPGGGLVSRDFRIASIAFDPPLDEKLEGACFVCAYADRLRMDKAHGVTRNRPNEREAREVGYEPVTLKDRLRSLGLLSVAKVAVAETRLRAADASSVPSGKGEKVEQDSIGSTGNEIVDDIGFHWRIPGAVVGSKKQANLFPK